MDERPLRGLWVHLPLYDDVLDMVGENVCALHRYTAWSDWFGHVYLLLESSWDRPDALSHWFVTATITLCRERKLPVQLVRCLWNQFEDLDPNAHLHAARYAEAIRRVKVEGWSYGLSTGFDAEPYGKGCPQKESLPRTACPELLAAVQEAVRYAGQVDFIRPATSTWESHQRVMALVGRDRSCDRAHKSATFEPRPVNDPIDESLLPTLVELWINPAMGYLTAEQVKAWTLAQSRHWPLHRNIERLLVGTNDSTFADVIEAW